MRKMIYYLGGVVVSILLLLSCSKEENIGNTSPLDQNSTPTFSEMTTGQAHNYLLEKAYVKFGDNLRSTSGVDAVDIMEVIEYWGTLEEVQSVVDKATIEKVKSKVVELYDLCRTRGAVTSSDVLECLEEQLKKDGNVTIRDLTKPTSNLRSSELYSYRQMFDDVAQHSEMFWSSRKTLRASNTTIILSDAAGAVWGGFFSAGLASTIAGAAASLIAEHAEKIAAGYDWRCNPKYI